MTIYKYSLTDQGTVSLTDTLPVKENESNYSLLSNPRKRIPKGSINKVNPEDMSLYLLSPDTYSAVAYFMNCLVNQAEVYEKTAGSLRRKAAKLLKQKERIGHS